MPDERDDTLSHIAVRFLSALLALACVGSQIPPVFPHQIAANAAFHTSSDEVAAAARASRRHTLAGATSVYVAIGASDSFGIGADDPLTQSWPYDLAHQMTPTPRLINLGIPGATTELALRAELPVALSIQPSVVTIWLGVNDIERHVPLDEFSQQFRIVLAGLRRGAVASIYVANLPDLTQFPYFAAWDLTTLTEQVEAWNDAIEIMVAAAGAHLVDIYGNWRDLATHQDYLAMDHLHPSARGAQRIAEIFLTEMAHGSQQVSSIPTQIR